jgi:hypothetical protein
MHLQKLFTTVDELDSRVMATGSMNDSVFRC